MIETWQIILAIIIVGLSIVMPIYYSRQRKNKAQQEEAIERMQIREYGRKINDETRAKKDRLN
jgi:protein involved in sex pheromone biosynthesis